MSDNSEVGKLFVGGLSWETDKDSLREYFSKYGEIVDCVVMMNNETGKSRGFGFVTFKDPACVNMVLQTKPHELHGRMIDAKECTPRNNQKGGGGGGGGGGGRQRSGGQTKLFMGGLAPDVQESEIRNAMSIFGKVLQVNIMMDQETKKCRGFGFLSFESEDCVEQALSQHFVNIQGKQVELKSAESREKLNRGGGGGYQNGRQGGYGGGGGGGGGYQNWSQGYNMQAQGYGGYNPGYGTAPAAGMNSYGQAAMPYAANQYQQGYQNYGMGAYGYSQAAGYAQAPAATAAAYGQPASAGYSTAAATPDASQGYSNPSVMASGKSQQGYHPYRR